ncbi:hypothetical protein B5K08_17335 [Rhizobium leguminosarum bv. trifolii]|uniref:Uncharacterized protein n=1 Tax=Rhizobium leguminosarum bv. trifolii TaxID=386 RepID=A0A3E1BFV3_RHILT|nr:hypothetical protein B5K08_17335 [Rhizobium leguminosarum bv. trifolii]RFB91080.1 hypothetical protein B5K10_17330 [Rhizobium leguminosarum bv. trifolii]
MILSLAACLLLAMLALREHRKMMTQRHRLLDEAAAVLTSPRFGLSADHHPVVSGSLQDGTAVTLDVFTDTMVTRRLPQLWLRVTLQDGIAHAWPSVGILARPTGSEYYSAVHGLNEWLTPPTTEVPVLMRGTADAMDRRWHSLLHGLAGLVADPRFKEAVVTPRMVRVVVQAAEGERSAHLLLRQARFSVDTVPQPTIRRTLDMALELRSLAANAARRAAVDAI